MLINQFRWNRLDNCNWALNEFYVPNLKFEPCGVYWAVFRSLTLVLFYIFLFYLSFQVLKIFGQVLCMIVLQKIDEVCKFFSIFYETKAKVENLFGGKSSERVDVVLAWRIKR